MKLQKLEQQIAEANKAYRNGESILSDQQYDILLQELGDLDPNNELLSYFYVFYE